MAKAPKIQEMSTRISERGVEPCPLCGGRAHTVQPVIGVWNVGCGDERSNDPRINSGCGLVLFGDDGISRAEMVRRWNRRSASWTRKLTMLVGEVVKEQRSGFDALASAAWDNVLEHWCRAENGK